MLHTTDYRIECCRKLNNDVQGNLHVQNFHSILVRVFFFFFFFITIIKIKIKQPVILSILLYFIKMFSY